jgi:hypothetical protein
MRRTEIEWKGLTVLALFLLLSSAFLGSSENITYSISGSNIAAQNWDTQLNYISDSTLTKSYLRDTEKLQINGPLGSTVLSFRIIMVPKSGAVKAYGMDGDTVTSPIRSKLLQMEDLDQVIFDQTVVNRYGKQSQLNPAYYQIIGPID